MPVFVGALAACGVVYYAPPKCPEVGEFLYFGGEFKYGAPS